MSNALWFAPTLEKTVSTPQARKHLQTASRVLNKIHGKGDGEKTASLVLKVGPGGQPKGRNLFSK